jgi:hypothetical protein
MVKAYYPEGTDNYVIDYIDSDGIPHGRTIKHYDAINPDHYKCYSIETIDMMVKVFGLQQTAIYCEITAFKYRMRLGNKPENSIEQDLQKECWYLDKKQELENLMRGGK